MKEEMKTRKPTKLCGKCKVEMFWTILKNTVFMIRKKSYLDNFCAEVNKPFRKYGDICVGNWQMLMLILMAASRYWLLHFLSYNLQLQFLQINKILNFESGMKFFLWNDFCFIIILSHSLQEICVYTYFRTG